MKKTAASKTATKAAPVKAHADTTEKTPAAMENGAAESSAAAQPVKPKAKPEADVKEKGKKVKLVRDSFTMPEAEYAALGEVKKACLKAGIEVKKSELLRAGVALVRQMDIDKLNGVLQSLTPLKAGRPKKDR